MGDVDHTAIHAWLHHVERIQELVVRALGLHQPKGVCPEISQHWFPQILPTPTCTLSMCSHLNGSLRMQTYNTAYALDRQEHACWRIPTRQSMSSTEGSFSSKQDSSMHDDAVACL